MSCEDVQAIHEIWHLPKFEHHTHTAFFFALYANFTFSALYANFTFQEAIPVDSLLRSDVSHENAQKPQYQA
jgi:hypothetical protein